MLSFDTFDIFVLSMLHNEAIANNALSVIAVFGAHYLPFLVAFFSVLFVLSQKNRATSFIGIYGSVAVAMIVLLAIQILVGRDRPYEVILSIKPLIGHPLGFSFPSGHAVFFSALASGVYLTNKKTGLIFAFCAVFIGISRIAVGVHWPSDILIGLLLGWTVVAVVHRALFQKSKII